MGGPNFNNLFKWTIENSAASRNDEGASKGHPATKFDVTAMQDFVDHITGSTVIPKMTSKMDSIEDTKKSLVERANAFEQFIDLVRNLDNADSLEPLKLWIRLTTQLENPEAKLRALAADGCKEAVANHIKTQKQLLGTGAIPTLVKLATEDPDFEVRKKAVGALSAVARNYQLALDEVIRNLPAEFKPQGPLDAGDMGSVALVIDPLRASYASLEQA